MKQTILFLRNNELITSEELAISKLNEITHKKGQPVVVYYGEDEDTSKFIFAIGKKDGIGENCYDILANTSDVIDVSEVVGELASTVTNHVATKAGVTQGHVLSGGDLSFTNGIGTVKANSITYSKMQKISAANKVLGSLTASGVISELGKDELLTILGDLLASRFKEAKTIELTGDVTGTVSSDFSGKVSIVTSIADDSHNHTISNIDGLQSALDSKAPLSSPALTGTPTTPTAAAGTNTTQIASTAFVIKEINDKIAAANALQFKGTIGSGGTVTTLPASHKLGDTYVATTGCPNVNGQAVESGDMIICTTAGTSAKDSDWTVIQKNIDGAVTGPASSVDGRLAVFSGATGKVIKDGGVAVSNLVQTTRTVSAGTGLTGGGALSGNITISHGKKPSTGTDAGGTGTFVTGVTIDSFGHVSSTTKASLTGGGAAESGKYVSGVTISGTNISVTKASLPAESGKVKIDSGDTADYLINKIKTGLASGNTYAVTVTDNGTNLTLSCTIDTIDGGTF